jgi:glucose-1-phosphate thymidylyltransferase
MPVKGIILAGGSGTRLYPMTSVSSKQLQPVYDKPMIYYPLSTLMLGGIRDILIISTPQDTPAFRKLLGDGHRWGIDLSYEVQQKPGGIAEAFIYGRTFIGQDTVCLILGDNIFYGKLDFFLDALNTSDVATIFAYSVQNPSAYGVVELDKSGKVLGIEEKPKEPKSDFAIPGLYVFPPDVVAKAQNLNPSARGELEITDIHKLYLSENRLNVEMMGRGIAWLDTGTPENLIEAGTFIHAIEKRQGRKIACLEEIALEMGFITKDEFQKIVSELPNCSYKDYCNAILKDSYQSGF